MARYDERLKQWDENKIKHIATGIRKKFEEDYDFSGMDDRTVLERHRARFAETMSPEDYEKKLNDTYAPGYEAKPTPNLLDKGQTMLEHTGEALKEMAPTMAGFGIAEGATHVAPAAAKGAFKLAGQAGFVAGHAANMAVQGATEKALEKTKEDLVQRDPEQLAQEYFDKLLPGLLAKGWTQEDIGDEAIKRANNVMKGYQQTVGSLEEDITQTRADQVGEVGKMAADAFFLGVGAPAIQGGLQKGLEKIGLTGFARAMAKPASATLAGAVGRNATAGALVGVPGMALQSGITAGLQAATDGATPQDIGRELTKGAAEGAKAGLIGGVVLGAGIGALETAGSKIANRVPAAKAKEAYRAAQAEIELDNARLEGWQEHRRIRTEKATAADEMAESRAQILAKNLGIKNARQADLTRAAIARTAVDFDPHVAQLPPGTDAGDVATTLIQKAHGTDAALTEEGMRAASQIERKLNIYNDANAEVEAFQQRQLPETGVSPVMEAPRVPGQLGPNLGPVEVGGVEPPAMNPPSHTMTAEGQIVPPDVGPAPVSTPSEPTTPVPLPQKRTLAPLDNPSTPVSLPTQAPEPVAPAAPEVPAAPEPAPKAMNEVSLPSRAEEAIGRMEAHPNIAVIPSEGGHALHIEKIGMSAPGGKVGDALNALVRRADEDQLPITIALTQVAGPRGGHIPIEKQFESFYKPRGFRLTESTYLPEGQMATARLRREPVKRKMSMLKAQEEMHKKNVKKQ